MSDLPPLPPRPPTPQAILYRLPNKPDTSATNTGPSKQIILIMGSIAVAGKLQIAKTVSAALSCPLFNGDSLHESSAKAASVGAPRHLSTSAEDTATRPHVNELRYQRMWLSKMTRTGLLFPEESRPANEVFPGFGGTSSSTSTSQRGSSSSVASMSSDSAESISSGGSSFTSSSLTTATSQYTNKPSTLSMFTISEAERLRRANRMLMVLTHPELKCWHRNVIREVIGEYGIGVLFVPLYEDEEMLPVLKPLDPRTMTSFGLRGGLGVMSGLGGVGLEKEMVLRIDTEAGVEAIAEEIIDGVRDMIDFQQ